MGGNISIQGKVHYYPTKIVEMTFVVSRFSDIRKETTSFLVTTNRNDQKRRSFIVVFRPYFGNPKVVSTISATLCAVVNQLFDKVFRKTWLLFSISPSQELFANYVSSSAPYPVRDVTGLDIQDKTLHFEKKRKKEERKKES